MMEEREKIKQLSILMCYLRAEHYFDDRVQKVEVGWAHWGPTWRCLVKQVYKNGDHTERISNDPLCKYIVKACFTSEDLLYITVDVDPPTSHQVVEASFQLMQLLGPEVNFEEILF